MLSTTDLTLALAAVTAAGVVSGLTGFGFALVSVPFLMLLMPPAGVVVAVLVIGEVVDCLNAVTSRSHVDLRLLGTLVPTAGLGMVAGSYVLVSAPPLALKLAAGGLVVVFALLLITKPPQGQARSLRGWTAIAGGVSGILTTSVGLSGPPVVLLASAFLRDKHRSRATLAAFFTLIMPVGLAILLLQSAVPTSTWSATAMLVPGALVGRAVGSRLHRRTPQALFRGLSLTITLATGLEGIAAALLAAFVHR